MDVLSVLAMGDANQRAPEGALLRAFDVAAGAIGWSRVVRRASFVWSMAQPKEGRLVARLVAPSGVSVRSR